MSTSQTEGLWEGSPDVEGTTLLKPVPYEDMDKDEREKIIKYIEYKRSEDPTWRTSEDDVEFVLPFFKLVGFDSAKDNMKIGPVLQVNSVAIFNKDSLWNGVEIYGQISITGNNVPSVCVYERDVGDCELVSPGQNVLSLNDRPIAPVRKGKVMFKLFSRPNDDQIFSKSRLAEYKIEIDDDCTQVREKSLIVAGRFGYYARMDYSIIPFAYIADVDMHLVGRSAPVEEGRSAPVEEAFIVEGEIKASTFDLMKSKVSNFLNSTRVQNVYRAKQSRSAIAIPVTASLPVAVSVCRDGREFATGVAKIDPASVQNMMWHFHCTDKKHYFRMFVNWSDPDTFFDLLPVEDKSLGWDDKDKYAEVFSIFIGGGGSNPSPVCGSIVVRDRDETVYIFSRNEKCADNLSWDRRYVSLAWPDDRWVLEKDFYMHLKLKDIHGNPLCRGGLNWSLGDIMRLDRRMCAVIQGKDGYFAAVHYSIFRNGLRAKVTLTVDVERPCDFFDVYGSVFAEYSNWDYSSAYDKDHYRIIIFKRAEKELAKVQNSGEIPLSKSLITAPLDLGKLIVHVNMSVRPFKDSRLIASSDLSAVCKLRFVAGKDSRRQLSLRDCVGGVRCGSFAVKVEWFGSLHGSRVN